MSNRNSKIVVAVSSLLLAFVVLGNTPALHAQAVSIASVTGRVMDPQGALVTGAAIRMSDAGEVTAACACTMKSQ